MAIVDISFKIEVDEEVLEEKDLSLDDFIDSLYLETEDYSSGVLLNAGLEEDAIDSYYGLKATKRE